MHSSARSSWGSVVLEGDVFGADEESLEAPRESLVAELELYRRQFEKVKVEVNQLASPLDDAEFNARPAGGGWSVAECLAHLNITNASYLPPIDDAILAAREQKRLGRGPFKHSMLGKYFARSLEPPVKRKFGTPKSFVPEPKAYRVGVVLPTFITFQDQLIERVHAANGVDLWKVKVRSQFNRFFRFSLGDTFAILLAHERRHLWQARKVLEGPGVLGPGARGNEEEGVHRPRA